MFYYDNLKVNIKHHQLNCLPSIKLNLFQQQTTTVDENEYWIISIFDFIRLTWAQDSMSPAIQAITIKSWPCLHSVSVLNTWKSISSDLICIPIWLALGMIGAKPILSLNSPNYSAETKVMGFIDGHNNTELQRVHVYTAHLFRYQFVSGATHKSCHQISVGFFITFVAANHSRIFFFSFIFHCDCWPILLTRI